MSLDVQLHQLDERGYVLLPGVLEPLRIALLRCAIDDLQPLHWPRRLTTCLRERQPLRSVR